MDPETVFSVAGVVSMLGWLALLGSPWFPRASDWLAGSMLPATLAVGYIAISVLSPLEHGGGFGTFAEVTLLFSNPSALLAGWVHFLAFDLGVGAWICRTARAEGIRFWWVVPCLPLTFLVGPGGFLAFSVVRLFAGRGRETGPESVQNRV